MDGHGRSDHHGDCGRDDLGAVPNRRPHTVPRQVLAYNGHDVNSTGYGITVNTEFDDPPEGAMRALYGGVSWWESSTTVPDDELHVTPRFSG